MLFSRRLMSLIAAASLFTMGMSFAQAKVLATVNGMEITDADVAIAESDIGSTLPPMQDPAEKRAYVLDYLIDLKLVAKKAEEDKMGQGPDFQRRMQYYHDKALMEDVLTSTAKTALTPDAIQGVYDEAAKAQKSEVEYHAKHILVQTEDEAKAAEARLQKGEDFAKLATELSKDPGSKEGDLGWFTKDRMVPEFGDAVSKLEPGQVSAPVKSQFGWHIIKLEEKRPKAFPALDTVKTQVERYVVQRAQGELVKKLHDAAKIEKMDDAAKKDDDKKDADKATTSDPVKPADEMKPAADSKPADAKPAPTDTAKPAADSKPAASPAPATPSTSAPKTGTNGAGATSPKK